MMRVNYSGNKRRKEEERRKKQEEKRNKRLNKSKTDSPAGSQDSQSGNFAQDSAETQSGI